MCLWGLLGSSRRWSHPQQELEDFDALSSAACFQDKHFPGADSVLILEVEREFHALRQLRDCGLLHVMYIFFVEMVEVMVG